VKVPKPLIIIILIMGFISVASAQEAERKAKIIDIEGEVKVKLLDEGWVAGQVGMLLGEGDVVVTKGDSEASLSMNGNGEMATVNVYEDSQLMLTELAEDEGGALSTLLELGLGKILIKAKKLHSEEEKFEVKTPTTIVGVRGTTFAVEVEALE
jgi:hypothetical protein